MSRKTIKRLTSTPGSKSKKLRKLLRMSFGKKKLDASRILTPQLTSIKPVPLTGRKDTPGKAKKRKKADDRMPDSKTPNKTSAVSPRIVLSRHASRGFLDSPITIDDSVHEESQLIDLSDLPDHEPMAKTTQSSKKRVAQSTPKSKTDETMLPPAKKLAFDKSIEEGELPPSPMNARLTRVEPETSSDIEIVAEIKAKHTKSHDNWRWKTTSRYFNQQFQERMRGQNRHRNRRAPAHGSTASLDRHRAPHEKLPPPPLVPNPPRLVLNPANYNFTEALNIVPGGVFEFKGNSRPLVPRMGARQISSSASCSNMGMANIIVSPNENGVAPPPKTGLRPIVIDGSNVAMSHGQFLRSLRDQNASFSSRGIQICVDYFKRRGHKDVVAIIPHFRLKSGMSEDRHLLETMERQGYLMTTPSRDLSHGGHIASYDDRFIVQRATLNGGVIVSNDNFRDLMREERTMRDTIDQRLLMFRFLDQNTLMFPTDPLGSKGPNLDAFLNF